MQVTFVDSKDVNEKIIIDLFIKSMKRSWLRDLWRKIVFRRFTRFLLDGSVWKSFKYWLIYSNGEVIGYVLLTYGAIHQNPQERATIQNIYILPQFRGRGISKHILTHIENFCDDNELHLGFRMNPEWEFTREELFGEHL